MPENGVPHKLELQEIGPADLENVARFISRLSGSSVPLSRAVERLSWILLENPARENEPLGWLLRSPEGEVMGCICCAPQKFCFGQSSFTLMFANSFYVDQRHRGSGTSLFLKFLQLGRRYPLFVSSANPDVGDIWQKLGARPLGNSDRELIRALRWEPFLEESVYRKTGNRRLARCISAATPAWFDSPVSRVRHADGRLEPLLTPEDALRICTQHRSGKLTGCRDLLFLKWRYFSAADPTNRLYAFYPGGTEKAPSLVGVRFQNRGFRQQIRALHVLDIWGEPDPNSSLAIAGCLERENRSRIDMLVFRCLDEPHQHTLTAHGFKVRSFPAPIAWSMDKSRLLPGDQWYFVPADGDMFL